MSCEELKDMYELYALGVLEAAEREEIDSHLQSGCANCERGLRRALDFNTQVFALSPAEEPPARLRKKVLAGVGIEKTGWSWVTAWAAAALCLLVAVLWLSVKDRRQAHEVAAVRQRLIETSNDLQASSAQFARVRQALAFLNEPETQLVVAKKTVQLPPKARVFLNASHGVLLMADHLPQAPAGKIYEMWVIPKGGAPKPAGLFQSDANGDALHLLTGSVDIATTAAVAVTLEPESGSPAPTTTPLIVTGL